jgi:mannose-6-phosphate isomerase-like protein (cupin superfamily)
MKNVKITSEGLNHAAIDLGSIDQLIEYTYMHPKRHQEIEGKVFVGEILKSTGSEMSFTVLPPNTEMSFMHQHKKHEEIYVFLKGSGQFQVDDSMFDVCQGSVIRVSPEGKRTYRNNSSEPLVFLCIQSLSGSLDCSQVADGYYAEGKILWKQE